MLENPRIPLWIDLRDIPVNKRLPYLKAVRQCRVEHILVGEDDAHKGREHADPITLDGDGTLRHEGTDIGSLQRIEGKAGQEAAKQAEGIILVDAGEWTVIPLENLIAARRDRPGTLYALARTLDEVRLFRETLEVGVHGIVLAPDSVAAIEEADEYLRATGPRPDDSPEDAQKTAAVGGAPSGFLVPATVTSIEDGGSGDRVCVDTTRLLRPGEGLLVGSTAKSFALVHAETLESEYVRARPFRINAGAIHSYIFAPGGKTQYLSELQAGDPVLVVHPDGVHRACMVGRAKVEQRPHLLLHWECDDGHTGHAMLQNAETIRLVTPEGEPRSITELQEGDRILVHNEQSARHFGMPVQERLEER